MSTSVAQAAAEGSAIDQRQWRSLIGAVEVTFGPGTAAQLPALVERLGGNRVLIVTDPGVRAACGVDDLAATLDRRARAVVVFDEVAENPRCRHVDQGTRLAREHAVDILVGFGGGSAMDCAKGINFLLTNGGRMEDYWGVGKASKPMLPSIGVPTTAGTGSEAQRFALISQDDSHRKMACGDDKARFRAVVLDPELTLSTPRQVAVAAGADAISHAVESYVSKASTTVSRMYAREAWRLLSASFSSSLENPDSLDLRGRMLLGAHLAGAAIECSMLGAAHACANPLTAWFEITHGIAVGAMLPGVVRYNDASVGELYAELIAVVPENDKAATLPHRNHTTVGIDRRPTGAGETLARHIEHLWESCGADFRLGALGVERASLPSLAREAAEQWTAGFNPRPVEESDLLALYHEAY